MRSVKVLFSPSGHDTAPVESDSEAARTITPYPWQVTGVAWLMSMEASPLGGGLIADDMGLGKTITTLLLVLISAKLSAWQRQGPSQL